MSRLLLCCLHVLADLIAALPIVVRADLPACPDLEARQGLKLVLGDVRRSPNPLGIRERNHLEVRLKLLAAAMKAELGGSVSDIVCWQHYPENHEFTLDVVRAFDEYGVLVELWGSGSEQQTLMNFVLIPVRHREFGTHDLPGIYVTEYEQPGNVFEPGDELKAYASLARAIRVFYEADNRSMELGRARNLLCDAEHLLFKAEATARDEFDEDLWKALRDYTGMMAAQALQKLTANYVGPNPARLIPDDMDVVCPRD